MITGFNTDIEHNGVVYHVQTEDKGLDAALILSLVYDRGTILASKRTPYDDLIENGFDEKVLAERLQKQHKLICAAVRNGRIEDLKKMAAKDAALKRGSSSPTKPVLQPAAHPIGAQANELVPPVISPYRPAVQTISPARAEPSPPVQPAHAFTAPIPQPNEELVWDLPLKIIDDELVVEADGIIDDATGDTIVLDDAIQFVEPIPTYNGKLEIDFATKTTFRAGERKTLQICVHRGDPTKRIVGVQIVVKVLGSSFRPLIFHAKTDATGIAVIHLQVPQFRSGRAALLVRALDKGEEAELRQIVRQG
ncbi:MAG: hypothetical protein IPN69_00665 [Acidobacteria bacterium]|nr:hypothetical protein [Acidobacteriota bacterium]MBK8149825.1 hypothetical protein [Acidobacteriota bacterium]MBK8809232.1 hypothetical protein [Acidobacteriota bacterium]